MTRFTPFVQAAILALTAYFLFSVADVSAKILTARYSVSVSMFIPAFIATIGIALQVLYQRGWNGFQTPNLKIHLVRSIVIGTMVALVVNALKTVPIADFYCIIFLSPFLVMMASHLLFKEPLYPYRVAVVSLAFLGVLVTIGPHFDKLTIGYAFVLIAICFGAGNIVLIRKIKFQEYAPLYGFFPLLAIVLGTFPFAVVSIPPSMPPADIGLFLLYGIALIGAHTFMPMAFAKTPEVSLIAPFHYSQMLWGMLASAFIFNQGTEITTYIGGGIILMAGVLLLWTEKHHLKHPEKHQTNP